MRAALGLGGIAAMSAIAAGIVGAPRPDAVVLAAPVVQGGVSDVQPVTDPPTDPPTLSPTASATQQVIYVQLKPGETAPPGATVLPVAPGATLAVPLNGGTTQTSGGTTAATPRPTPKPLPKPTPIIIKTTQSGKVVP